MFVLDPVLAGLLVHKNSETKFLSVTVLPIVGCLYARSVERQSKISFQRLYSVSESINFMSESTNMGITRLHRTEHTPKTFSF